MSDREHGRPGSGPGGGIGFAGAIVASGALLFAGPVGWVLAAVGIVGAFLLLRRDDSFQRDLGAGVLAGVAVFTLVFGACTVAVSTSLD